MSDKRMAMGQVWDTEASAQIGVQAAFEKYSARLTWGRGRCLAILDDGFDVTIPHWQVQLPWGPKVLDTYSSMDGGTDVRPAPGTGHGTTVGFPSSLNYNGELGVAFNNQVALVRCVSHVHMTRDESETMAAGLRWVVENHDRLNITTVNLAPVDDIPHKEALPTAIDAPLKELRQLGIWVSAPCANNEFTDGISWPACAADCVAIGAVNPETRIVHRDRWSNVELVVASGYTSSSNAFAAGCAMVLREAIDVAAYPWQDKGATLPEAMLKIFQETGTTITDEATGFSFQEMNLLAALDSVLERA